MNQGPSLRKIPKTREVSQYLWTNNNLLVRRPFHVWCLYRLIIGRRKQNKTGKIVRLEKPFAVPLGSTTRQSIPPRIYLSTSPSNYNSSLRSYQPDSNSRQGIEPGGHEERQCYCEATYINTRRKGQTNQWRGYQRSEALEDGHGRV